MGKITTDQSHSVIQTLATNTDWSAIDFEAFDLQNRIMRDQKNAGRDFMNFLKNYTPKKEEKKAPRPCMYSVTSDGRDPKEVASYLEFKGFKVSDDVKKIMEHPKVITTCGINYIVGIIFVDELPDDDCARTYRAIFAEAKRRGWVIPPVEIAYLSHERMTTELRKEMGLRWFITMHEWVPELGFIAQVEDRFTTSCWANPEFDLSDDMGCAFVIPQIPQIIGS